MIVGWDELVALRGTVTMVGGGFDPLHAGHVAYFEAAAALGAPVLIDLASDAYVATKHPPLLPQDDRARVLDALRPIAYVHPSRTTTEAVLRQLRPRRWVKGDDWSGESLPPGEMAAVEEHGIELVTLDTVTHSSSAVLDDFLRRSAVAAAVPTPD